MRDFPEKKSAKSLQMQKVERFIELHIEQGGVLSRAESKSVWSPRL